MTNDADDGDDWEIPDFGLGTHTHADDQGSLTDLIAAQEGFPPSTHGELDGIAAHSAEFDRPGIPLFSIANPAGTVTATASIAGRLHRIELAGSRSVASMTEAELAQEILVVARLAGQKARSELFTYLVDRTAEAGQDPVATGRFLRDDVGLPTPEESAAARAEAFGPRFPESHG